MSSNVQVAQPRRRGPRAARKNYKPKNLNLQFKRIERGAGISIGIGTFAGWTQVAERIDLYSVYCSNVAVFPIPIALRSPVPIPISIAIPFPVALFWLKWNTLCQLVRVLTLTFRLILICSWVLLFLFIYFEHNANNFVIIFVVVVVAADGNWLMAGELCSRCAWHWRWGCQQQIY